MITFVFKPKSLLTMNNKMESNKKEIKILVKWILIGLFAGIFLASILAIGSVLTNSTPDGKYVEERYCRDEDYTGEEICDPYGRCQPVIDCPGGFTTRKVAMGEQLRSLLRQNLIGCIPLGIIIGFMIGGALVSKNKYNQEK